MRPGRLPKQAAGPVVRVIRGAEVMVLVRYNPPQRMISRTRLFLAAAVLALVLPRAQAANWTQPVAALARKIAVIAGPGQVQLAVTNRSSIQADEVPRIQSLLTRDLRGLGVTQGGADSATQVTVTLSENVRGGLWVAQVQEGTVTQVAMLPVKLDVAVADRSGANITLQRRVVMTEPGPVLDAEMIGSGKRRLLVVLGPRRILVYEQDRAARGRASQAALAGSAAQWVKVQDFVIPDDAVFPRDMRGRVVAGQQHVFDAYLPGMLCKDTDTGAQMNITCGASDDPWPVTARQSAFYDASRDYFEGVLVPGFNLQLAPFYEAAEVPRAGGSAILLDNVDGSASLIENGVSEPVHGVENWGSDLAAVHSACGLGTQVVVSGSGAAETSDSLRAYEIAGREAIPVSAPLQVPGTVMAIWPSQSGNDAMVMVRMPGDAGYEVWSVAATCD